MHKLLGVLLILFSWTSGTSPSQPLDKPLTEYLLDTWDHNDGLPGSSINALLQTRDGYLWIGTNNGLHRFDGMRFVVFDRESHPGLLSNRIRALFEDRQGNLWIGTDGGGVSTFTRGAITTRTAKDGIPSDYVRAIAEDRAGVIWIGTDGEGLGRIRPDTSETLDTENDIIDKRVTSLLVGRDSALWVGTFNGLFKHAHGRWSKFTRKDGLSSDTITCMRAMGGDIWFGTYGGGLTLLRGGRFSVLGGREGLPGTTVSGIAGNDGNEVFVATLRGGISRIRDGAVSSRSVGAHDRGAYATAVLEDREGNIWIGLQDGRLVRLRDAAFSWYPSTTGSESDPVRSVIEDRNGTIWAGTASHLRRLEAGELLPACSARDYPINVLSVGQDSAGTLWVGTLGHGLQRVVERGFATFQIGRIAAVWALYTDPAGILWAGTNGGLVAISNDQPRFYTHDTNGLSHEDVRAICRSANGSLWVGTSYGLNKMVADSFVVYTTKTALSNDVIVSLHADANGDLWVGTIGGLNRLRDTTVTTFTMADGLPDDAVGMILEDDKGFFWIGSDKGLYRVEKENLNRYAAGTDTTLRCISFGKEDGMLDPGIAGTIQPAAWKSRDGRLWFATAGGLAMADPARLRPAATPPLVVIEKMVVDRREISIFSAPVLTHDLNQIEIEYTAPAFVKPEKVTFRYRLEGLTEDWIEAGGRRTAYFTHLPPGEYTFEVAAVSDVGIVSARPAELALTILPPFWMTWWFRGILLLAFLSVGPSIYFWRVSQLKRKQLQQQEFALRLLESQEAERKRIAAELHDSLGQNIIIIKNRALLAKQAEGEERALQEQLDEISRTASATLDEMRKIAHNLRPVNLERFGLTDTIAHTVEDVGAATGIALTHSLENIDRLIAPEVEIHFFRIVQEALNNIVKHSKATRGAVTLRQEGGAILLRIQDDGVGFDPGGSTVHRHDEGFGLEDISQRARLIGAFLSIDSVAGEGTSLRVSLPMREKTA